MFTLNLQTHTITQKTELATQNSRLNLPKGHCKHSLMEVAAGMELYFPWPHSVQLSIPGLDVFPFHVPAGQLIQTVPANTLEYFPCAHSRQFVSELAAKNVEYFPCPHEIQEFVEICPTVIEYVPGLQCVQLLLPGISLNVPAAHAIHTLPE